MVWNLTERFPFKAKYPSNVLGRVRTLSLGMIRCIRRWFGGTNTMPILFQRYKWNFILIITFLFRTNFCLHFNISGSSLGPLINRGVVILALARNFSGFLETKFNQIIFLGLKLTPSLSFLTNENNINIFREPWRNVK